MGKLHQRWHVQLAEIGGVMGLPQQETNRDDDSLFICKNCEHFSPVYKDYGDCTEEAYSDFPHVNLLVREDSLCNPDNLCFKWDESTLVETSETYEEMYG